MGVAVHHDELGVGCTHEAFGVGQGLFHDRPRARLAER